MMNNDRLTLRLAIGALLLIGAGCSQTPAPSSTAATTEAPADAGTSVAIDDTQTGTAAVAGEQHTVEIIANGFNFVPAEVRVKQGDKVRLEVTSTDVDHGIAIPAFNLNAALKPNTMTVLEFTADKKGSFPFFCSVFCGTGHGGMRGTLIVE